MSNLPRHRLGLRLVGHPGHDCGGRLLTTHDAGADDSTGTGPGPEGTPDILAALDIGTNSFHLVVARFTGEGHQFEVIAREKEMVRLGSGGGDMKQLADDAIDRGIASLTRFRQIADVHGAHLHAVATSAVREADNAAVFLDRARDEAGVEVDVISGAEEARLIHLGVLQAVPVFDRRLVLIDIGGGSTEVLVGEQGRILTSGSLKLGAIRMTRRFFRTDTLHPAAVDSCRRHVRAAIAPLRREVAKHGFDVAVGSSGTITTVAAMIHAARDPKADPPRVWNSFAFTRSEVGTVVRSLVDAPSLEVRQKLPGIDSKRADILLAGAIILDELMGELGIETVLVSDYALREGVLLEARDRERGGALNQLHDLRRRNVAHLGQLMDSDPEHSARTARLALELFDATHRWHGLGADARELLESAALLANVGQYVSHDQHHKHSYYVIRNSDRLTGFTDHEIELIALIARYHRKSGPKRSHPEFAARREDDQVLVRTCAGILRIAIGLDRTHAGLVERLRVAELPSDPSVPSVAAVASGAVGTDGAEPAPVLSRLVIIVVAAPEADLSLEMYTANDRKDLLESVLGRAIDIVSA